jgi:mycobactin lysine-N-oxygenase
MRWRAPTAAGSRHGQDALDLLELGLGGPLTGDALQEAIGRDLAVTDITPKLFLPGLSGLTQGPDFPTCPASGCCPTGYSARTSPPPRPTDEEK